MAKKKYATKEEAEAAKKEDRRRYRERNKDAINKKNRESWQLNKDTWYAKQLKYREENRDRINDRSRKYAKTYFWGEKHEEIKQKNKERARQKKISSNLDKINKEYEKPNILDFFST